MSDSPLSEAKPDSMQELFSRDPEKLTRQDRDAMVAYFREKRAQFAAEEAKPKESRRKKTGTASLEDLGF